MPLRRTAQQTASFDGKHMAAKERVAAIGRRGVLT
jgi:hypothetical protein